MRKSLIVQGHFAVTEKGFISFAARESRGTGRVERRESDETAR
jgi:hypothetical protein